MRLMPLVLFAVFMVTGAYAAEPPDANGPGTAPTLHMRPRAVACTESVNVWVEVDERSLPTRDHSIAESKKRVQLNLIGSSPARGDAVVCSYASRSRDITTSFSVRCVQPRKERGRKHSYICM